MKAVTIEFEVTDKTAPTIEEVTFVGNYIYVRYSEAMSTKGNGSVLNKDNYKLVDDNDKKVEIKKIELFGSDKNKVRITVGSDVDLNGDYELTIANVEDEAGNAISAFDVKAEKLSEEEAPKVSEIRIISKTEIEIVIDKILDKATVEKSDFEVERGSNKVALTRISSITYDDGKTIVKGVLRMQYVLLTPETSQVIRSTLRVKLNPIQVRQWQQEQFRSQLMISLHQAL